MPKFDDKKTKDQEELGAKTGKQSKGKGKNNRSKGKPGYSAPKRNDYTFYAANDTIAAQMANIPFNYVGGKPFPLTGKKIAANGTATDQECSTAIPAVMTIDVVNAFSTGASATSAMNMASLQLYNRVRGKNSGATKYEAPDVMMYVLAMRDIYSEYFEIKKIIGMPAIYSYFNHNLPKVLVEAMGIDYDDLVKNQNVYRGRLNLLADRINAFIVPKYFKAFDRAAFSNSAIFTDSDSMRSQFYIYRRRGYYKWSGRTSTTGTELRFTYRDIVANTKLSERMDILEEMIDGIFYDADAMTMSADIGKAFSEAELFRLAMTEDNFVTSILNNDDAKAQIENMITMLPTWGEFNVANISFNVTQENTKIKWNPTYDVPSINVLKLDGYLLNSHKDNPDYKDVLEWTRLMPTFDITSDGNKTMFTVTSSGLELPLGVCIYTLVDGNSLRLTQVSQIAPEDLEGNDYPGELMHFDWHPFIYRTKGAGKLNIPCGDSKVITYITEDDVKRINDTATYGAFYWTNADIGSTK